MATNQLGKIIFQTASFIKIGSVRTKEKKKKRVVCNEDSFTSVAVLGILMTSCIRLERTSKPSWNLNVPNPSSRCSCILPPSLPRALHRCIFLKAQGLCRIIQVFLHKVDCKRWSAGFSPVEHVLC